MSAKQTAGVVADGQRSARRKPAGAPHRPMRCEPARELAPMLGVPASEPETHAAREPVHDLVHPFG
jgi:hypothetical protein